MIILGIDPGTAKMGWGIVKTQNSNIKSQNLGNEDGDFENHELVEYGCFETPAGELMERRLLKLFKELREVTKKFKPDVVAIERLFFNTNAKTAISVGQARGVVMLATAEANVPLVEYTALQAKLALTGYGRAEKQDIQKEVKKILKCRVDKIRPDDAADALAIALCHILKKNGTDKKSVKKAKPVKKVKPAKRPLKVAKAPKKKSKI